MDRRARTRVVFLCTLLIAFASSAALFAGGGFAENYSGNVAVTTDNVCRLKAEFPTVQTVQVLPFGDVQDLMGDLVVACKARVMRGKKYVANAKIRPQFQVGLVNTATGATRSFQLTGSRVRTDDAGVAKFMASIPGEQIIEFVGTGGENYLGQTVTQLGFSNNKRSDYVTLSCNGGFGAGCAQYSCSVGSPCSVPDRDGDGVPETCLTGFKCASDGDTCNSADNDLGKCYTEYVVSRVENPTQSCDCTCDT